MVFFVKPNTAAVSGVEFVHRDLLPYIPQYELIADCIAGEQRVKEQGVLYLPIPGLPGDKDRSARYDDYRTRAVFYNVAGRTLDGLVGRVFTRDPVIEVPKTLDPVIEDASGESVSLEQMTQASVASVLKFGGIGLYVDYPMVAEAATRRDIERGNIRPTVHSYDRYDVVNWRVMRHGGKDIFTMIVLRERYQQPVDEFATREAIRYRVLRLVGGIYTTELWATPNAETQGFQRVSGPHVPLNYTGQPYDEIPFRFVGPRRNGSAVEKPPLYDLCSLNIGHYRNSADYEDSCYMTGQPTVWAAGLNEAWVKNVLGGKMLVGARGILPLPDRGQAGILQPQPNTLPFEAMQHKERQMLALGAKLVEQRDVQRTATEAGLDAESESSVLSSTARNVSQGYLWALQWCGYFVGVKESAIKFELNTDFDLTQMSAADRLQLVKEWQAEAITFTEMRAVLRQAGVATLSDEEALAEIEKERVTFMTEDQRDFGGQDPNNANPDDSENDSSNNLSGA